MLTISLDSRLPLSLYEQIYLHIRSDIRSGRLGERDKLPSTRALAAHLCVSRNTVDMAYGQLLSEGYIEAKPKSGYYVCQVPDQPLVRAVLPAPPPASAKALGRAEAAWDIPLPTLTPSQPDSIDFSPFAIDTETFPYRIWQRLTRQCLADHGSELFLLGDRRGEASFRESIAKYLYEARGFLCSPDHIIVGAGADYLLQLLVQLLGFPQQIAMENPCYMQAYRIFSGLGCQVDPIPVDGAGIACESLFPSAATAVYLTPSHQYPLGAVLSATRRRQLLDWADGTGRFLIEDDHDSEFRYKGKPIPALKEMDHGDSVIYIGTFSRSIAPAIRVGYMVLPDRLMECYHRKFRHYASTVSRIDQMILSAFLSEGYYERHLNKCRKLYKSRHDTLLHSLKRLGNNTRILGENAGLHLALQPDTRFSEAALLAKGEVAGLRLYGLSAHFLPARPAVGGLSPGTSPGSPPSLPPSLASPGTPPTLLLGFGSLPEERIQEGIRRLAGILGER